MNETASTVPEIESAPPPGAVAQPAQLAPALAGPPAKTRPISQDSVGALGIVDVLTAAEVAELESCETVIRKGWLTFVEVGRALATIRHKILYKNDFNSFEEYCHLRWGFHRTRVYTLMAAAKISSNLAALTNTPQPDHESQLRPLFGLTPGEAQVAWQYAAAKSCGRPVTARLVKAAVRELNLTPAKAPVSRVIRPSKAELRRQVNGAVAELLTLARQKASHEALIAKLEALDGHVQALLRSTRSSRSRR